MYGGCLCARGLGDPAKVEGLELTAASSVSLRQKAKGTLCWKPEGTTEECPRR